MASPFPSFADILKKVREPKAPTVSASVTPTLDSTTALSKGFKLPDGWKMQNESTPDTKPFLLSPRGQTFKNIKADSTGKIIGFEAFNKEGKQIRIPQTSATVTGTTPSTKPLALPPEVNIQKDVIARNLAISQGKGEYMSASGVLNSVSIDPQRQPSFGQRLETVTGGMIKADDDTEARYRERIGQIPGLTGWANRPTAILGLTPAEIVGVAAIATEGAVAIKNLTEFGRQPQVKLVNQVAKSAQKTGKPIDPEVVQNAKDALRTAYNLQKMGATEASNEIMARFNEAYTNAFKGVGTTTEASTAVKQVIAKYEPFIPKGTQTGAMAFGGKAAPGNGDEIAKSLGIKFDGIQQGHGNIPDKLQFTDSVTGSTTYGNTLEEVKANIENMRAKFESAKPKEPSMMTKDEFEAQKLEELRNSKMWAQSPRDYKRKLEESIRKRSESEWLDANEQAYISGKDVSLSGRPDWSLTAGEVAYRSDDTLDTYIINLHDKIVAQAIKDGKPVPPEVVADYKSRQSPKPISVDDDVIFHSPFTNEDVVMNFRGYEGNKAVLYNKKSGMQIQVPKEQIKPIQTDLSAKVSQNVPEIPAKQNVPNKEQLQSIKDKIKSFIEIQNQQGGLTEQQSKQFKELTKQADILRFQGVKPLSEAKLPTPEQRLSSVKSPVIITAHQDLISNQNVFTAISEAAHGVAFNENTAVDKIMLGQNKDVSARQLYDAFASTRDALRQQYGDTVKLYRAVGQQQEKPTTNWASTEAGAKQYGNNVISKDIPVDNIVALNVGLNGKYEEFIVTNNVPTTPPMSPSTSIAPDMFGKPVQTQMLGEVSGKTSQKTPLTQVPQKGTELPGQTALIPEEAIAEEKRLMEIEGRKAFNETQEWAKKTFPYGTKITGRKAGVRGQVGTTIRFVDLVSEGNQLDYTTYKKAKAIDPHTDYSKYNDKKNRPKFYNKVPLDGILEQYASEYGFADADAFREAIIQLKADELLTGKPRKVTATAVTQQPPSEPPVTPTTLTTGVEEPFSVKDYTPEQVDALAGMFGEYLSNPSVENAWALTQELRHPFRAQQASELKDAVQRLMGNKDLSPEESLKIAIKEVLSKKLPVVTTDYFKGITDDLKQVLKLKVYNELKNEPFEMVSTITALDNALSGKPIPSEPGVKGGSAMSRLQRVFGNQPKLIEGITKIAEEKKPLEKVVEGIFREPGQPPVPIDQDIAAYLNGLATKPLGQLGLGEQPFTPPSIADPRSPVEQELARLKLQRGIEKAEGRLPPIDVDDIAFLRNVSDKTQKQLGMLPPSQTHRAYELLRRVGIEVVDLLGIPKSMKFAYDVSMPLRQGFILGLTHPAEWVKAWKPMIKSIGKERFAIELDHQLRTDPESMIAIERLGLDLYDVTPGAKYMNRPESLASTTAEKYVPGIRQSNRAAATYMNKLMVDVGKYAVKTLRRTQSDTNEYKAFGEYINWAAGRGTLPKKLEEAAGILNTIFTSPRYVFSRIQLPGKLASSSPVVRKEALKTLIAFLTLGAMILGLGKLAGAEIELDPRSADAYKLKIGNKRIDWWLGYAQMLRFISQLSTGTMKLRDGTIVSTPRSDVIGRFLQSKESPGIGALVTLLSGKNFNGEKMNFQTAEGWAKFASDTFSPAAIEEMVNAYIEEGTPESVAVSSLGIVGVGVNTYGGVRPIIPQVNNAIGQLGGYDQTALDSALKGVTNPAKIAEIKAKDYTYDIQSLRRDMSDLIKDVSPADKSQLPPIAQNLVSFLVEKDTYSKLSTKEQESYLKSHPDFTTSRLFWGDGGITTIPNLKTAQDLVSMSQKYGIKLDMIPAFQKTDKGQERIPSEKTLWPSYFSYYDLPGSGGYLSYSKEQVAAGKLPEQYKTQWETYQKLQTDTAKTAYRKTHVEASTDMKEALRRKDKAFDSWLVEQGYNQPLDPVKTAVAKVASRSSSAPLRLASGSSGLGSVAPRRTTKALPKFKKIRVKTGTSIRAPGAPRI